MKKIYMFLGVLALIVALPVEAHVKWFVDSDTVTNALHGKVPFYAITSKEVLIWSILTVIVFLCARYLDKKIPTSQGFTSFVTRNERVLVRVAQALLGVFLIVISFFWKIILIPDFPLISGISKLFWILQILAGVSFLFNIKPQLGSLLVISLYIATGLTHGIVPLAENLILLSLALFFFIKNAPANSSWKQYDTRTVEIVRICTGLSLIILAFTEKLMYPELSIAFLAGHHWNFMQPIFPWFSDTLFVLSVGFAEALFGLVFIFGYLTRVNTLVIALFFVVTVTTMAIQSHLWEVEDLVVYTAAVILVFFGSGGTYLLRKLGLRKT